MNKKVVKFVVSLCASLGVFTVASMGLAGASSISNTGPGSHNYVSGSYGSIDMTGPDSVNVIGGGHESGNCYSKCEMPVVEEDDKDCDKPAPKPEPKPPVMEDNKDCDKPKPKKHHHKKWCFKWCGHSYKWCQVEV